MPQNFEFVAPVIAPGVADRRGRDLLPTPPPFPQSPRRNREPRGCTLARYAEWLNVPEDFLSELGLTDSTAHRCSVRVPYVDDSGAEIAVQYRIALDGDRHRWHKGAKPHLFGLSRLNEARSQDLITLVVGEDDAIVLLFEGYHAVALPSATAWSEPRDARYFDGFRHIFIAVPPEKGGAAVLDWLRSSTIRERACLVTLPAGQDAAALYKSSPAQFAEAWNALLATAVPWSQYAAQSEIEAREAAKTKAARLLAFPDILEAVADQVHALGVARERQLVKLAYLCATTRVLKSGLVSLIVKGESASGKSYIIKQVLRLFPDDAYLAFTSMSNKALAYTNEALSHRMLVLYEAAGLATGFLAYMVRTLLSEGHIKYSYVANTRTGPRTVDINKPGPTGLICTTTDPKLHHEIETRCLSITVDDSSQQTSAIMRRQAELQGQEHDLSEFLAVQTYLSLCQDNVIIPYATWLSDLIKPRGLRLRRDFLTLQSLIRAHALLHQSSRARADNGAIIANTDDYRGVRDLYGDVLSENVEVSVPESVRETVAAVASIIARGEREVPLSRLADALNLGRSTASRRVKLAAEAGYLQNLETRKGRPARVVLGAEIPNQLNLLPEPEELERER